MNKVDQFFANLTTWKLELEFLRSLALSCELVEDLKWGAPSYACNGRLAFGLMGFKKHFAIAFHQGVLLEDQFPQLFNAQQGKTKAMRQWRFDGSTNLEDQRKAIRACMMQAKINAFEGHQIDRQARTLVLPEELKRALLLDDEFSTQFNEISQSAKIDFAEYLANAKQSITRLRRLEKIKELVLQGRGLNDKYR